MTGRFLFKLLIVGSEGSGKTRLLRRYTPWISSGSTKMSIGVDFSVTTAKIPSGAAVTLQIWDIGGEERFRTMLPTFCLGARGCMMVFDPLRPETFYELDEWITIVRNNTKNVPILLLSSKQDLIDEGHISDILQEEIDKFVARNNLRGFMRVSGKTGINVRESFQKISETMIDISKR